MNKWEDYLLGDFVNLKRGFDLPEKERIQGDFPIVSSSGVTGHHKFSKVKGPGVVTGRYGTLGKVFYVESDFWPLNTSLYVQDFKGNDKKFVKYYLQVILNSNQNAAGAVPGVNRNHLHKLKCKIPSSPAQKKITATLSAYDDLIENNKRRIAILEKMAEEIYKEWFVRMRFPEHENVTFVKGVPGSWEYVKIENAFQITGGGTPSKENDNFWKDGNVNWYTPTDLTSDYLIFKFSSGLQCNELGLEKSSARLFPAYSIMMTSRATIGVIAINVTKACTNQGFITCIPNTRYPLYFLYNWLKSMKQYFISISSGATFAELTKGSFKKIVILTPPAELALQYQNKVAPLYKKIEGLIQKNNFFKQTRNRLLTRLISGKLSVADLDIRFPRSMREESDAELHP